MKKIFILLFNIFSILLILIICDYFLLLKSNYNVSPFSYNPSGFRTTPDGNLKKLPPIITIGCSFTYGTGLANNQTFAYKLQQYTSRKVYNRGMPCWGIQHILYQLRNDHFYKEIKPPEYVIYVFIDDHIRRMYVDFFSERLSDKYLQYEKYKGGLRQINTSVEFSDYLKVTLLYKIIKNQIILSKSTDEKFDLFELYLLECRKEVNKLYKDSKFVVIKYPNVDLHAFKHFETGRWDELKKEGFIVIDFDDNVKNMLITNKYLAEDGVHPSEKAWDLVIPILAKKLHIDS